MKLKILRKYHIDIFPCLEESEVKRRTSAVKILITTTAGKCILTRNQVCSSVHFISAMPLTFESIQRQGKPLSLNYLEPMF